MKRPASLTIPNGYERDVSIFDKSVKKERRGIEIPLLKLGVVLTVLYWVLVSITFGAVYKQDVYTHRAKFAVVDMDKSTQSAALKQLILAFGYNGTNPMMPTFLDKSDDEQWATDNGVATQLKKNKAWAAWTIAPGFGSNLTAALANGTDYNPATTGILYMSDTHSYYPLTRIQATASQINAAIVAQYQTLVLRTFRQTAGGDAEAFVRANPRAMITPYQPVTRDITFFLYPISNYVMSLAISMNLVLTFIPTNMWKIVFAPFWRNVKLGQAVAYHFLFCFLWLIWASLMISLLICAYHNQSIWDWSAGDFFGLWFIFVLGTMPDFCWILLFQSLVTPVWVIPIYIMTLFLNIPATLFGPDLSSTFFRWFYAMPYYNTAYNMRTMFLHADHSLQRTIVIPLAWTILFVSISTWLMIRRARLIREDKINAMNIKIPPQSS